MALSEAQIDHAITERLERWGRHLRELHATPIMLIGLAGDVFVVDTLEEMTENQIEATLLAGLAILRRKHRDRRPKR